MRHLTISEYDAREGDARVLASYPAFRAFSPAAFNNVNFPGRVTDERELIRYSDIMHETFSRQEYLGKKQFSETEAANILQLSAQIRSVTEKNFGTAVQPLMCLFHPMPILRAVEMVAKKRGRKLKIFEIGPGSGYLGAYLVNQGHAYTAVDITQALYLWQNRLFSHVTQNSSEWVLEKGVLAKCNHIPWWQYSQFYQSLPMSADLVICDAALGEMNSFGFHFNIRMASKIVQDSDCGALIFQEVGEQHMRSRAEAEEDIKNVGFSDRSSIGGVSIFSLPGRMNDVFAPEAEALPFLGAPSEKVLTPNDFLPIKENELLESYHFFRFLGWGV